MLQRVAVCSSVLQCVAVCCSVLQCVAVCCSVLQCVAVCCSVLQCVAVCCSVLPWDPDGKRWRLNHLYGQISIEFTFGNVLQFVQGVEERGSTLQHTATHCNTLQHTSKECYTLQHTATHCITLQHSATHCNTLQHTATCIPNESRESLLGFRLALHHPKIVASKKRQ